MELTAAEPRRKRLVQLFLDGEPAVKIDLETYLRSGLRPGDELDDERLHQLILDSQEHRAKEKALYLLEHRAHSKKELTDKIVRSGADRDVAKAAADRMEELGLVNDEAYARALTAKLFSQKGWGKMRVRQELRLKGIDRELIDALLEEFDDEDRERETARQMLQRKYPGWDEDEKIRRRAMVGLQRLGYTYDTIRSVLRDTE